MQTWHREYPGPDPSNSDTSSQAGLEMIVPLLFKSTDGILPPRFGQLYPAQLLLWRDIPFGIGFAGAGSGRAPDEMQLVNWADAHGRLIAKPLRPADDPCRTVDELLEKLKQEGSQGRRPIEADDRDLLRLEAWRMLTHIPQFQRKNRPDARSRLDWAQLKADVRRLGVRWDEKHQEYVCK